MKNGCFENHCILDVTTSTNFKISLDKSDSEFLEIIIVVVFSNSLAEGRLAGSANIH